jgi:hypothetical protein
MNEEFGDFDNCPDAITLYCEDENGILYRYLRTRGSDIEVKAREDRSITDVPIDVFRIEYFGQGELARIAENPLKHPRLFQEFLDRHTNLRDLIEDEQSLVTSLRENASRLNPLETAFAQLTTKRRTLDDIEKKLKIAEEGNLREVVGIQSKLASEKTVREAVEAISTEYKNGFTFSKIQRDFGQIVATAGTCTDDAASKTTMAAINDELVKTNAAIKQKELELNALLRACAKELDRLIGELKAVHNRIGGEVALKLSELRARGVTTDIPGLESLLREKTSVGREIAAVEQRGNERTQAREERVSQRARLKDVREQMTRRRKAQLKNINANLAATINDYTVFVRYDDAGITDEFEEFLQEKMHGTYLQDDLIQRICGRMTPSDLADWALERNYQMIATTARISREWAEKVVDRICYWNTLFELQALAKQPKPIITVRTKSTPPREIPVLQLSDGQRHTILLTIAMLAESNVPLVIDQPEDDLDNAFISTTIVRTLRAIKERRQVSARNPQAQLYSHYA